MDNKPVKGSCLCGGVEFELDTPFVFFQHCHCSRCQKSSGSAHATNILVKAAQFRWREGEQLVRRWQLPEAEYFCSGFCSECGSPLPWRSRNDRYVIVPAGSLDDDPGVRPQRNVFWASRASWEVDISDLPTFDERP